MTATSSLELLVRYQPVGALKPYARNARTHSKRQVRQIADSIKKFGFTNPILVDRSGTIIAGQGRFEAAELLGMDQVPTISLEFLTPDQIRAYVIADNRLAEAASWDKSILAIEFQHLVTIDKLDMSLTGFEPPEINLILQNSGERSKPRESLAVETGPAVTAPGDLWELGRHRVVCGSTLRESTFSALIAKRQADVVFTDLPENTKVGGKACGEGCSHDIEFPLTSSEMPEAEFTSFLTASFRLLVQFSAAGSIHFICIDWRHIAELLVAGSEIYSELLNVCVWKKDHADPGSFYRSQHELIFVFRNGTARRDGVRPGSEPNRTNVWQYPSVAKHSAKKNSMSLRRAKPVALIADALVDCSAPGNAVLDSFLGSGSTLIAAESVGRVCYGIELDPICVDTAIRRWESYTGDHAIHAVTGKRFDEIATQKQEPHHAGR